ncbi:MAG: DNA-binding transcriptional LysR family regulator [Bacteriovoracaceae bacterium]|jgi:DNA-binding transcriptional LysR family regulator
MYWITIDQIECFQAISETGSFQKASEKLNKAKSAVMYSVKNLEEQLGFPLLDRSSYRSKVTPQGEAFLFRSKKILENMSELHDYCNQIASEVEMKLSISVSGIFNINLLYPVIKNSMKVFPSTEIILEKEILSGEKMLQREMVDIAIFENIHNKRELDFKSIGPVKLVLVISSDHPFLKLTHKEQTREALYKYPQIVQRSTIQDEDHNIGVHSKSLKWKVTDTPSKKDIIMNGLGWGRLPLHTVEVEIKNGTLTHLKDFKDDDEVEMYICKRKNAFMGKVSQMIWDSFEAN